MMGTISTLLPAEWSSWLARIAALAFALALAQAPAARADVVVLSTCVLECTDEDLRAISTFRRIVATEFERPGLAVTPISVLEALDNGMPRPAVTDVTMTARRIADELKLGVEHWINGRYERAAAQLEQGLTSARFNPGLVVSDPTLRQLIPRAHVGRAVSLLRLKRRAAAKDAMLELVQTLPEQSILDSWGTEADKIFQSARKELEALGKGNLVVEVDDPSTIFYLNESGQPHRAMYAGELYPGTYRVLVQDATGRSRRFLVGVWANETTMLRIRWRRDTQFASAGDHIGFVFESEAERAREGDYARHFASLASSELVVVVGRIRSRGESAMIGTIYNASTRTVQRAGIVPLSSDEPTALRALATFLFSPHRPAPQVRALDASPWEHQERTPPDASLPLRYPLGWACSAGAIALGASLIALDPELGHDAVGYALVGAGVVGGVLTTILYIRRGEPDRAPVAALLVSPTSSGWLGGVRWQF